MEIYLQTEAFPAQNGQNGLTAAIFLLQNGRFQIAFPAFPSGHNYATHGPDYSNMPDWFLKQIVLIPLIQIRSLSVKEQ